MKGAVAPERGPRKRARWVLGCLLTSAAIIAVTVYGPEAYGLVQLGKQIDTISSENARLGGPWPRASEACLFCHGINGNARAQNYPRLAGQPEAYLKNQLQAFVSGDRRDPTMTPLALSMSTRELENLAAHFARMTPAPNSTFHPDPTRVARGEALARSSNCAACHGAQLQGRDTYPRLAGQGYSYLVDQLERFKSGERRDASGAMPAIVAALSTRDIEDLAHFIASR